MSFVRVDPQRASGSALGILIPHGARTLVIVRPRALEWDLLPARWDGEPEQAPTFCTFERDEAAQVARRLLTALESTIAAGVCPVQTFGDPEAGRLQIWLRAADLVWIVCKRTPGQAYQPLMFASIDEASSAAEKVVSYVWPIAGNRQEIYFNTQNLS